MTFRPLNELQQQNIKSKINLQKEWYTTVMSLIRNFILVSFLVSCQSIDLRELTIQDVKKIKHVGIVNYASPNPKSKYIGLTKFNNKLEIKISWGNNIIINEELQTCLEEKYDYETTIINPSEFTQKKVIYTLHIKKQQT